MKTILLFILVLISNLIYSQQQNDTINIREFIIKETQEGGKLDFFTEIKGKEYNGSQVKPGVYASNIEIVLYRWGKTVKELGIKDLDNIYKLYSEARGKEINPQEKTLLKMAFDGELD